MAQTISIVEAVDYERIKTEHAEPRDGGETRMTRTEAKQSATRERRQTERAVKGGRLLDDWGDLDRFSAQASRGVLRHMTADEEVAGFSWGKFRPK